MNTEGKCLTRWDYMLQALYDAKIEQKSFPLIRETLHHCFTNDKK